MRSKQMLLAMMVGMLMLAPALAAEPPCPGGEGPGMGGHGPEAMDEMPGPVMQLDLTAEQIQQLKEDKVSREKAMVKLHAQMETLQIELRSEVDQDKPDLGKIEKLAKEIGNVHSEILVNRTKSVLFLKSILTLEQKQTLDKLQLSFPGCGHEGKPGKMGFGPKRHKQ